MADKLKVLDLFSGIGGFSLGLERTGGFETVAFCEIDRECRDRVLAKHWPQVRQYHDIRKLTAERLATDGICVDVICGGFPCQDISVANVRGQGLAGEKSGLWREFRRLVGELRPCLVLLENVAALLGRGLIVILADLASIGYDAEWEIISASDVGAPHDRERLWLVAYPTASRRPGILRDWSWGSAEARPEWPTTPLDTQRRAASWLRRTAESISPFLRDDDGLPGRLAEASLGQCGNSIVPQIPEMIGRAILDMERDAA